MESVAVVEGEVSIQPGFQFHDGPIIADVDILVLERSPEALDKQVFQRAINSVHADPDPVLFQFPRECLRRKLAALIGI
jgi:hypothetical protein